MRSPTTYSKSSVLEVVELKDDGFSFACGAEVDSGLRGPAFAGV
jgi:hypothetical protein